jgi:hypothetical protein
VRLSVLLLIFRNIRIPNFLEINQVIIYFLVIAVSMHKRITFLVDGILSTYSSLAFVIICRYEGRETMVTNSSEVITAFMYL